MAAERGGRVFFFFLLAGSDLLMEPVLRGGGGFYPFPFIVGRDLGVVEVGAGFFISFPSFNPFPFAPFFTTIMNSMGGGGGGRERAFFWAEEGACIAPFLDAVLPLFGRSCFGTFFGPDVPVDPVPPFPSLEGLWERRYRPRRRV